MEGITPDANPQYDGVPLDPPPSIRQGFGRAHLGRSLPIASNPSGWSLQVVGPFKQIIVYMEEHQSLRRNTCLLSVAYSRQCIL